MYNSGTSQCKINGDLENKNSRKVLRPSKIKNTILVNVHLIKEHPQVCFKIV